MILFNLKLLTSQRIVCSFFPTGMIMCFENIIYAILSSNLHQFEHVYLPIIPKIKYFSLYMSSSCPNSILYIYFASKKKFTFKFNLRCVEYHSQIFVAKSLNDSSDYIFFSKKILQMQTISCASIFFASY